MAASGLKKGGKKKAPPARSATENERLRDELNATKESLQAIIEERETTIIILPSWHAKVDATGCIMASKG